MDDKHQQRLDRIEEQLAQLEALQAQQRGKPSEREEVPANRLREDAEVEEEKAEQPQGIQIPLPLSIPALRGLKVSRPGLWLVGGLIVAVVLVFVILPAVMNLLKIGVLLLAGAGVVWYAMRRLSASGQK